MANNNLQNYPGNKIMRCFIYMSSDLIYVSSFDKAISTIKHTLNTQEDLPLFKHKVYSDVYSIQHPNEMRGTACIVLESSPIFNCMFLTRNPLGQIYISGNSSTKSGKALINSQYFSKIFTEGQRVLRDLNNRKNYDNI